MWILATITPLFFTSSLCQFLMDLGMRPDVTFGEDNDRFDVSTIIKDQNRMLHITHDPEDYRRYLERRENNDVYENNKESKDTARDSEKKLRQELLIALKNTIRRLNRKQADLKGGISVNRDGKNNFKASTVKRKSLEKIVDDLHAGHMNSRRGAPPDPENEILFHYGVPIDLKVEGYLQVEK